MHAMVLKQIGAALEWTELRATVARPGRDPREGRRLRRLPHGSACRRRRIAATRSVPIIPGPRDRRPHRRDRRRRRGAAPRRAGRHPLARPYLRRLPLLHQRAREPVRSAALHRLHARRRLRHGDDRRCALRLPAGRGRRRRGAGAAAVRRADRLARRWRSPATARRWASTASARPRISWRRWRAGRAASCSPSPGRATRQPGFRPQSRRGLGRRLGRDAAGAARCRDHLRRRSARWCRWR